MHNTYSAFQVKGKVTNSVMHSATLLAFSEHWLLWARREYGLANIAVFHVTLQRKEIERGYLNVRSSADCEHIKECPKYLEPP